MKHKNIILGLYSAALFALLPGCEKYVTVNHVEDRILNSEVFSNENTANHAVAGIYRTFKDGLTKINSISVVTGLSSDELTYLVIASNHYEHNSLQPTDLLPWKALWQVIYRCNAAIEGINASAAPESAMGQLAGEAKFWRAYCYFYLINLFGEVPLILETDVHRNAVRPKSAVNAVYDQILKDLLEAENLLANTNLFANGEKTRVNKWAVRALLARIYLYRKDWPNALNYANLLINSNLYPLGSVLANVFKKNSSETILSLANGPTELVNEPEVFLQTPPQIAATASLVAAFDTADARKAHWMRPVTFNGALRYAPAKYTAAGMNPPEYYMLFRIAEMYLIRAEVYANQQNFAEAVADVNLLRQKHGGLNKTLPVPATQNEALNIILQERRVELFAETGHRWFDLKRTGKVDTVIAAEKPGKWEATDALYPIPLTDVQKNPNLTQNPGYQ